MSRSKKGYRARSANPEEKAEKIVRPAEVITGFLAYAKVATRRLWIPESRIVFHIGLRGRGELHAVRIRQAVHRYAVVPICDGVPPLTIAPCVLRLACLPEPGIHEVSPNLITLYSSISDSFVWYRQGAIGVQTVCPRLNRLVVDNISSVHVRQCFQC